MRWMTWRAICARPCLKLGGRRRVVIDDIREAVVQQSEHAVPRAPLGRRHAVRGPEQPPHAVG
jgi:hypothetical protein